MAAGGGVKRRREGAAAPRRVVTKEDALAVAAQARALEHAKRLGALAEARPAFDRADGLRLPKAFVRCNNTEIRVKKTARGGRSKYLFVFPGQLAVLNAGVCGTVENVATSSPVMNIECDGTGKTLRLFGSVARPATSFLPMTFHSNGSQVSCEAPFRNVIVFHTFQWIEAATGVGGPLMAADLSAAQIDWDDPPILGNSHAAVSLDDAPIGDDLDAADDEDDASDKSASQEDPPRTPSARAKGAQSAASAKLKLHFAHSDSEDLDSDDQEADVQLASQSSMGSQRSQRSSSRRSAKRIKSYREQLGDSSSEEDEAQDDNDDNDDNDDEEEEKPLTVQRADDSEGEDSQGSDDDFVGSD